MGVRRDCATIPAAALEKEVRAARAQSRGGDGCMQAYDDSQRKAAKEEAGKLRYKNCHLAALFFATLDLTWEKSRGNNNNDTLETAIIESFNKADWNVDYTNYVAYKVSDHPTTPVRQNLSMHFNTLSIRSYMLILRLIFFLRGRERARDMRQWQLRRIS